MASATDVPNGMGASNSDGVEHEPLLGRPGDVAQRPGKSLVSNLWVGTAVLAQAGLWVQIGLVWGAVFSNQLILFSAHPLLNSAGIFLSAQSILLLQPTHTAEQKKNGALFHAGLNSVGVLALLAGFAVILSNKLAHNGTHFESPHAILGLVTYLLLVGQTLVGVTMYFVPAVYGGERQAKSVWKYHRGSGYLTLVLLLVTVVASTQTTYNQTVLHIRLWAALVASILVLLGVVPRVKKYKFGL